MLGSQVQFKETHYNNTKAWALGKTEQNIPGKELLSGRIPALGGWLSHQRDVISVWTVTVIQVGLVLETEVNLEKEEKEEEEEEEGRMGRCTQWSC